MKSDARLKRDVRNELEWGPALDAAHVGVAVNDGVVILSVHLNSFAAKHAVEPAVRRVASVRAIAIELDVKLEPHDQRGDADIAAAAAAAHSSDGNSGLGSGDGVAWARPQRGPLWRRTAARGGPAFSGQKRIGLRMVNLFRVLRTRLKAW